MKLLVKLILFVVMAACSIVFAVAFYANGQLRLLQSKANPKPSEQTMLDLVTNGWADNHHVKITEFTFGKPVIEKRGANWSGVWLPLHHDVAMPALAILHAESVQSQSQLDEFLNRTELNVLISRGLPASSQFRIGPSADLKSEYSAKAVKASKTKTDLKNTALMRENSITLPIGGTVALATLLAPSTLQTLQIAMFASFVLGAVCLAVVLLIDRPAKKPRPTEPTAEQYQRLASEPPISLHQFMWLGAFIPFIKIVGVGIVGLLISLIFLAVGSEEAQAGNMGQALLWLTIFIGIVIFAIVGVASSSRGLFAGISGLQLSDSGLALLQRNKARYVLWQDIAEVYRAETRIFMNGRLENTISDLTLKLYDGRKYNFSGDAFVAFEVLAERVQAIHGGWVLAVKKQELEDDDEATFGDVTIKPNGLVVKGTAYSWDELENYGVVNGRMSIRRKKYIFSPDVMIDLAKLPNYTALFSFLEELNTLPARRWNEEEY